MNKFKVTIKPEMFNDTFRLDHLVLKAADNNVITVRYDSSWKDLIEQNTGYGVDIYPDQIVLTEDIKQSIGEENYDEWIKLRGEGK